MQMVKELCMIRVHGVIATRLHKVESEGSPPHCIRCVELCCGCTNQILGLVLDNQGCLVNRDFFGGLLHCQLAPSGCEFLRCKINK